MAVELHRYIPATLGHYWQLGISMDVISARGLYQPKFLILYKLDKLERGFCFFHTVSLIC